MLPCTVSMIMCGSFDIDSSITTLRRFYPQSLHHCGVMDIICQCPQTRGKKLIQWEALTWVTWPQPGSGLQNVNVISTRLDNINKGCNSTWTWTQMICDFTWSCMTQKTYQPQSGGFFTDACRYYLLKQEWATTEWQIAKNFLFHGNQKQFLLMFALLDFLLLSSALWSLILKTT